MSRLDYSKALFGDSEKESGYKRPASSLNTTTSTRHGKVDTCVPDEDGNGYIATIYLDGSVDDNGDAASVTIRSSVPLSHDQRVTVIIAGTNITVIPDGSSIESIASTEASSVKDAINQNFWYDTYGAHVSDAKPIEATTKNILVNSNGMALYKGDPNSQSNPGTELASFTETKIELAKNCIPPSRPGGSGSSFLEVMGLAQFGLKRQLTPNGGNANPRNYMTIDVDNGFVQISELFAPVLRTNVLTIASSATVDSKTVLTDGNWRIKAATATSSDLQTLSPGGQYSSVYTETLSSTDSSYFDINQHGIRCKKAGKVLISGLICATDVTSKANVYAQIVSGASVLKGPFVQQTDTNLCATVTFAPFLQEVTANTVILLAATTSGTAGQVRAGNAYLTVQYV